MRVSAHNRQRQKPWTTAEQDDNLMPRTEVEGIGEMSIRKPQFHRLGKKEVQGSYCAT